MSTKPQTAYVITANDSVEAVVLGTEAEADAAVEKLKAAHEAERRRIYGSHANTRLPFIFWGVRAAPIVG